MVKCQQGQYLVKEHCRYRAEEDKQRKPRMRLSKREVQEIKEVMARVRPEVTPSDEKLPLTVEHNLEMVPSIVTDTDAHNVREARFILPFFFPHALRRLMDPKRRQKDPSIDVRYDKIKDRFMKRHGVVSVPLVYKYVLLKTCLDVYGR